MNAKVQPKRFDLINSLPTGSQKDIANQLGVSKGFVSSVLNGKRSQTNKSGSMIIELAEAIVSNEKRIKTYEEIAAEIWGISTDELIAHNRKKEVVEARHTLLCYRRRKLGMTTSQSAAKYGLKHNATLHSCKRVDEFIEFDPDFKIKHDEFIKKVTA